MITTWKCQICGKERDDNNISVITYSLKGIPGIEINLKYCNDSKECIKKSIEKAKTKEM